MDAESISRSFGDAEGHGFMPVPLPVRTNARRKHLDMKGGGDSSSWRMASAAVSWGPCRGFNTASSQRPLSTVPAHPAIRPHTEAFQIEVEPPEWLISALSISESESRRTMKSWMKRSRCLFLDRERRQFFVDTVSEVRGWLLLREALYSGKKFGRTRGRTRESAVHDLFAWLDEPPMVPDDQFVTMWERRFEERLAMRGCAGAGFNLGPGDEVRSLVREAFQTWAGRCRPTLVMKTIVAKVWLARALSLPIKGLPVDPARSVMRQRLARLQRAEVRPCP